MKKGGLLVIGQEQDEPGGRSVFSTTIGRGPKGSALIGRELQSVSKQAISCHKEAARASKNDLFGLFAFQRL